MNLEQIEIAQIKFINALRNEPEPDHDKTTCWFPEELLQDNSYCLCAKGIFFRTFRLSATMQEVEKVENSLMMKPYNFIYSIWNEMENRYEGWEAYKKHSYKEIANWLIAEHNWPDPQKEETISWKELGIQKESTLKTLI